MDAAAGVGFAIRGTVRCPTSSNLRRSIVLTALRMLNYRLLTQPEDDHYCVSIGCCMPQDILILESRLEGDISPSPARYVPDDLPRDAKVQEGGVYITSIMDPVLLNLP